MKAKTALVLSGGGSLGAVQVGMLQALSREYVQVDMVVGASVGALNGAFFADDPTPTGTDRLAELWRSLHREDVFPLTLFAGLRALLFGRDHLIEASALHSLVHRSLRMQAFRGRYEPAPRITAFPNVSRLGELMTIGPIKMRSACSHHFCPIVGKVWIGVLPDPSSELIGLSKYARICDWVMRRPQIQEEAVVMLADELERRVKPDGLAVVMEASHFCMGWRGVKDDGALMRNTIMRGAFSRDADLRRDFFAQLGAGDV